MSEDRSAALLLRVWHEDETDAFRARLTTAGEAGTRGHDRDVTVAVATSPGDVLRAIAAWLDRLSRDRTTPG